MADADEDRPHPPPGAGAGDEEELDDETQDFRFLSAFASSKDGSKIPRRGDKDFEPHGSSAQSEALASARQAMHNALDGERLHHPKTHLVGIVDTQAGTVRVAVTKGQFFRAMGRGERDGAVTLLPEEALYMLERGSLDVRWPPEETEQGGCGADGQEEEPLPMSLQAAYAVFLGKKGLTLDRYLVYASLRRTGYVVMRAPEWDGLDDPEPRRAAGEEACQTNPGSEPTESFLSFAFSKLGLGSKPSPLGPLVKPGLYRNYQDMYRRLAIIPIQHPSTPCSSSSNPTPSTYFPRKPALHISYHVYKPSSTFAKSRPGPPDFYLAIVSAQDTSTLDLPSLDLLFSESAPAVRPTHSNLYARLKTGWRNVVVGVVDNGIISYTRFSEAAFCEERLFEGFGKRPIRGSKGGRGGRGGRGARERSRGA